MIPIGNGNTPQALGGLPLTGTWVATAYPKLTIDLINLRLVELALEGESQHLINHVEFTLDVNIILLG